LFRRILASALGPLLSIALVLPAAAAPEPLATPARPADASATVAERPADLWKTIRVGTAAATPGRRSRGHLKVLESADGAAIDVPIAILAGRRAGPIVWIMAMTHGDEYGSARALQEVVRGLDPAAMSGTVVAVLVANPPALRGLSRSNPNLDDQVDMGDVFDGKTDGFATERIAATLMEKIRATADYVLDMHTGGDRFRQHPFILYTVAAKVDAARMDGLARSFGVPTLWRDAVRIFAKSPITVFGDAGIPTFLVEVGGGQPLLEADLRFQGDAIRSFLRGVGVTAGEPSILPAYTVFTDYHYVTNSRGGFFEASVKPGDRVEAGAALGTIRDVDGEIVETLRAPKGAQIVTGVSTYPAWASGGWLLELGGGVSEIKPPAAAARPTARRPAQRPGG
jgi:hypothetical protein